MIVDGRELPVGEALSADVCVVGGGPVGITLARALAGAGVSVCLLESGGLAPDRETEDLNRGEARGDASRLGDDYLTDSRVRQLGGASALWAGQMRPLDFEDFEPAPHVPGSGWPFRREALDPFYARLGTSLGLQPFDDGTPEGDPGPIVFRRGHRTVVAKGFQYNPLRFGAVFRDDLAADPRIKVVLHATASGIEPAPSGAAVRRIGIGVLGKPSGLVATAGHYVLAAGAIENARLLLASSAGRGGLGNGRDLVGRNFMEHPHVHAGIGMAVLWTERLARLYLPGGATLFFASPAWKRSRRMVGVALNLVDAPAPRDDLDRQVALAAHDTDAGSGGGARESFRSVNVQAEQAPNPASRVTLTGRRDALGMPRVRLEWRLGAMDLDSIDRFVRVFSVELPRAGAGRLKPTVERDRLSEVIGWGWHHMGTTRMDADPARGVVDADVRVHGIENLFVAGSSVFPTSGVANPTFTAMALALRLADHIGSLTRRTP